MRSVAQTAPSNRLELNDDGTPRRKYDQDETPETHHIARATIGLVLANAFILIKNVFFGSEPTYAAQAAQAGAQGAQQKTAAEEEQLPEEQTLSQGDGVDEPEELDDAGAVGSSTPFTLVGSAPISIEPQLAELNFRGSGRVSSNDNEQLYGATPGRRIGLSGDSIALSSGGGGGGHGGHSGGGSGGSDDDDPDHSGEDDDDHDDDDDNGEPQTPRQNRLPVVLAPVVLASLFANEARAITLGDLLAHASDPDGDALTVRNLKASSGTLVQTSTGWTFTPEADDSIGVTLTYLISDGKGSTAQTAKLDLLPPKTHPVITGSSGHDELVGTPGKDIMEGLEGNDLIYGREGNDVIFGGDGDDRLIGGDGDDVIYGGAGNDVIFGGAGNDVIDGEDGDDFVDAGDGDDSARGGDGDDNIVGGGGNDTLRGDAGKDTLHGDAGHDFVDGGDGDDIIEGGDGNDVVVGGSGDDQVALGAGNDTAVAEAGDGNDTYGGGDGTDTYDASSTNADAEIDLTAGTASSADTGNDTLEHFENVNSGAGDDTITGTDEANVVNAGGGNDDVGLAGGNDTVVAQAGDGNDSYDGGSGIDTYDSSSTSADTAVDLVQETASSSDTGSDTIENFENVTTGSGNDTVVGNEAANVITTGEGADCVTAGAGADTVSTGGGDDTVVATAGDGDDTYYGGSGNDTYDLSTTTADALIDLISQKVTSADVGSDIAISFENVKGGKGDDRIVASDSTNVLIGGEGNDRFEFHSSSAIGYGRGYRDQILDFSVGDRIDIDKVRDEFAHDLSDTLDDQNIENFVILSNPQALFSRPGELKVRYEALDGHEVTILAGNTDWDSDAEFELELAGHYVLTDNDFYRA